MKFILPTTSQAVMDTKITIRRDGSILFDNTYNAVSYTHLDVYKRQVLYGVDGRVWKPLLDVTFL